MPLLHDPDRTLHLDAEDHEARGDDRFTRLAHAGAALATCLDPAEALRTLARVTVPAVADACSVLLLDQSGALVRVAEAAIESTAESALRRLRPEPIDPDMAGAVLRALGEGGFEHFAARGDWVTEELPRAHPFALFLTELRATSGLVVPLSARGGAIGVMVLAMLPGSRRVLHAAAAELAREIAHRAGLAVENARLYREAQQAQVAAEAALHRMEEQQRWLERLLQVTPTPLVIVEAATRRLVFANRAARPLLPAGAPEPPLEPALRGDAAGLEVEWPAPDGARTVVLSSGRLSSVDGRDETVVVAMEDVTPLKQALRARDDFLIVASHELKTPLTTLSLQVDSLLRAADRADIPRDRGKHKLDIVRRQVDRLEELVQDLLDVSRMSAGPIELRPESMDLAEVAREVVRRMRASAKRAGSDLQLQIDTPVVGRWDRARVEHVFGHLLRNAIKYGLGRPVDLVVDQLEATRTARIVVRDRGIGIAPADQERIFGRFQRAASVNEYGGLGLGLWSVRQVLSAMGGRIAVESRPGEGATFTAELPLG